MSCVLPTVEFGFGKDAATEAESVFPVADIKGRHWRMMGYLKKITEMREGKKKKYDVSICLVTDSF